MKGVAVEGNKNGPAQRGAIVTIRKDLVPRGFLENKIVTDFLSFVKKSKTAIMIQSDQLLIIEDIVAGGTDGKEKT